MKFQIDKCYIETKKLNNNINICLISDIHYCRNYNTKLLFNLYYKLKNISPDYICITGDLIDSTDELDSSTILSLNNWLEKLGEICKVIISLGNHDVSRLDKYTWSFYKNNSWLNSISKIKNIYLLDNDKYIDNNICFIGYTIPFNHYKFREKDDIFIRNNLLKFVQNISNINYNILLCHTPIGILNKNVVKKLKSIDLILCGHTHGGLMPNFIKGNWGIISPYKKLFPKNIRGVINYNKMKIIISSGLIKLSKSSKIFSKFNFLFKPNIFDICLNVKNK